MDYSNESYERFQQIVRLNVPEDSLIWQLRDALFAEAFYGKARQYAFLYHFPAGWILLLGILRLKAWRMKRHWTLPESKSGAHHFLFLSTRNNHTARLFPLYRKQRKDSSCIAWHTQPELLELTSADERMDFHCVAGRWADSLRGNDLREARKLARTLVKAFPNEMDRVACNAIRIYLIQFIAWQRFWRMALSGNAASISTTFEKVTHAKAFFFAARELGVPRRIHWIHGLRHASIQATLATELWCMTPGDVRFFKNRVPPYCTPRVKENPEEANLSEVIGVLDPRSIPSHQPIHFLFLGPGLEASYTREMRMADLGVIKTLQQHFGGRIQWRFRPHPSASDRFHQELVEAGIAIEDFSTRHLHDDLKWSHAIGSSWSSLLLDVRATGRPIFWVQAEVRTLGAVDELIEDGIGVHLDGTGGCEWLQRAFPSLGA